MKPKTYVIFGAGKAGIDLARVFPTPVSYLVDNDSAKWGTRCEELLVFPPDQLLREDKENLRILIASMYFPQLQNQLEAMGFKDHKHYWNIIPYYSLLITRNLVDAIEAEATATAQTRLNSSVLTERLRMIFNIQNNLVRNQHNLRVLVAVNGTDRIAEWVSHIIAGLKDFFKLQVLVISTEELPLSANKMDSFIAYYLRMGYSKRIFLSRDSGKVAFLRSYFECITGGDTALSLCDKKQWLDQMYNMMDRLGFHFKKVSVVVPNYNYEDYLCRRLRSIIGQQYPIYEIIFLDDASHDDSVSLAKGLLAEHCGLTQIIVNDVNSGSVFRQWAKGIELSQGDYIWIAEADDFASPLMLAQLMAPVTKDEQVVLSFCDSMFVDRADEWQGFYSDAHFQYAYDSETRGYFAGIYEGSFFIKQYLTVRNSIPNASAVVMKKSAIKEKYLEQLVTFKSCGDWYFYIAILMEGSAACDILPMNFFTRHSGVVTLNANKDEYSIEMSTITKTLQSVLDGKKANKTL
jgi:glycosyltransferase involved in cell wall biosynthesis